MSSDQTPHYLDSRFELQYRKYGGFCGGCGEAIPPFAPGFPEDAKRSACKTGGVCAPGLSERPKSCKHANQITGPDGFAVCEDCHASLWQDPDQPF